MFSPRNEMSYSAINMEGRHTDFERGNGEALLDTNSAKTEETKLLYSVEDCPPIFTCFILGLQHFLLMVESTISIPYLLTPYLCMAENDPNRGYICGTILFVCGITTILQTVFGVRLPIVQGGTHGFLGPIFAILALYPCPDQNTFDILTEEEQEALWKMRIREIQGAICVSALFQVIFGLTGAAGSILKRVTPLVIVPTVTLIGLSLGHVALKKASSHWGISILTFLLLVIFSQYLGRIKIPFPSLSRSGIGVSYSFVFAKFPVLLALGVAWVVSFILTLTDTLGPNSPARTDLRVDMIKEADWFRLPYPCQWGIPTVSIAGVIGVLAAVLASIIESIGDYYVCARLTDQEQPPMHAVNRGIFMEGLGTVISGLFGTCTGTTSYSQNVAAISITRVGSRRVVQSAGLVMICCGVIGKVGAMFINIPEPIIGGIFVLVFGMITSVGLSNLQFVDLNSTRNLFIIGISIFCGLSIPQYVGREENKDLINTSIPAIDQIIYVILRTSMLIGGLLGFLLDNTLPGSDTERGLNAWHCEFDTNSNDGKIIKTSSCYDFPIGMKFIKKRKWLRKLPISPTFRGWANVSSKK